MSGESRNPPVKVFDYETFGSDDPLDGCRIFSLIDLLDKFQEAKMLKSKSASRKLLRNLKYSSIPIKNISGLDYIRDIDWIVVYHKGMEMDVINFQKTPVQKNLLTALYNHLGINADAYDQYDGDKFPEEFDWMNYSIETDLGVPLDVEPVEEGRSGVVFHESSDENNPKEKYEDFMQSSSEEEHGQEDVDDDEDDFDSIENRRAVEEFRHFARKRKSRVQISNDHRKQLKSEALDTINSLLPLAKFLIERGQHQHVEVTTTILNAFNAVDGLTSWDPKILDDGVAFTKPQLLPTGTQVSISARAKELGYKDKIDDEDRKTIAIICARIYRQRYGSYPVKVSSWARGQKTTKNYYTVECLPFIDTAIKQVLG